jgi:hypothetical protein
MRAITRYKTALKTISALKLTPIKLIFKHKSFDGFKFLENRVEGLNAKECNGDYLLIECLPEDIEFLDEPFEGRDYDICPGSGGDEFMFFEIGVKSLKEDVIEDLGKSAWKAYEKRQKNPEFELIFVNEN